MSDDERGAASNGKGKGKQNNKGILLREGGRRDVKKEPRAEGDTEWPHWDLHETDNKVVITADLPGVNDEDVQAEYADNKLIIKGSRNTQIDGVKYHNKGRHHGEFQLSIDIPVPVQKHTVKATFRHGIMLVSVRKEDPDKRNKKITFTFASSSSKENGKDKEKKDKKDKKEDKKDKEEEEEQ